MTACGDLYRKWKKEPNFCGLGKSEANSVNKYIEFVDDFTKETGLSEETIYKNAPRTAVKQLLRFKKDSDIRKKAEKQIAQTLTDKHGVSGAIVNAILGINPEPKKFLQPTITLTSQGAKDAFATNSVKDKIRLLTSVLTPGQTNILIDVMKKQELNNEYEAMALVLKWASERIKK